MSSPTARPSARTGARSITPTRSERVIYRFDVSDGGCAFQQARFRPHRGRRGLSRRSHSGCGRLPVDRLCSAAGAARRYAPDGAFLMGSALSRAPMSRSSPLPARTATAYATTAWKGLDKAARAAQPLAGGLFRFEVETSRLAAASDASMAERRPPTLPLARLVRRTGRHRHGGALSRALHELWPDAGGVARRANPSSASRSRAATSIPATAIIWSWPSACARAFARRAASPSNFPRIPYSRIADGRPPRSTAIWRS